MGDAPKLAVCPACQGPLSLTTVELSATWLDDEKRWLDALSLPAYECAKNCVWGCGLHKHPITVGTVINGTGAPCE